MDDLLTEFLVETTEGLASLDTDLVKLERAPNDPEPIGRIFSVIHTIKGMSGFLSLSRLEKVTHAAENVLVGFRDGALLVDSVAVTGILKSVDAIREILHSLETLGQEPEIDHSALLQELSVIASGKPTADPKLVSRTVDITSPPEFVVVVKPTIKGAVADRVPLVVDTAVKAGRNQPIATPDGASSTVRVSLDTLESLMTLVSELVLTRNQLLQMVRGREDSEFKVSLQRLSHITTDLQEGVMKTRMQPIGNAWARFPRIVRDLSVELGKKIDLRMVGVETELDRQVLELIRDPLIHMVRNAADYGIETPEERIAAGKPANGDLTLNAFHEGGHVLIEVSDDGRGLDIAAIRRKALERGLATESQLDQMADAQIFRLLFYPGFSNAEKATGVAGHKGGLDAVRSIIERICGTVDVRSTEGNGTTFVIKIPLTLAIVSALIVAAGGEKFAIPQLSVVELVRAGRDAQHTIERINSALVLRLRDRLLPLISLAGLYRLDEIRGTKGSSDENYHIVIAQVGAQLFGIIVDRVFDTEEIVAKPVSPILREIFYYSGNTILGDGSVIMILDLNGIASAIGQTSATEKETHLNRSAQKEAYIDEKVALLIFRSSGEEQKAIPLEMVSRFEEFERDKIEISGGRRLIQYRGQIMPLIPFDPEYDWTCPQFKALVLGAGSEALGLIVDEVVDIVNDRMKIALNTERADLIGTAIIGGKATDVVDCEHYLRQMRNLTYRSRNAPGPEVSSADPQLEAVE